MGLTKGTFILFLSITSFSSNAQDSLQNIVYSDSTAYIMSFPNRITARLFFVNTSNSLTINDRDSNQFFKLTPNKQDHIGASISFRSITLSYSFTPDFIAENKDNENSKLLNLGFRTYFGKHWMQSFDFFQEKGFYLENNDVNLYFPRFRSFKIGGATSYILNENFSFRAIVSQDEKQLKSIGSFIPRIVYYYSKIDIRNNEDTIDESVYSYDFVFAPSYFYNFVPTKNLFLSAGISAGIGLNHSRNTDSNHIKEDENLTSLVTELNFRGSLTYDISDLYVGTHYNYLVLNHNTDRSSYINDAIPLFQVFAGYRFKAPKKLVQKTDAINKKINLKI